MPAGAWTRIRFLLHVRWLRSFVFVTECKYSRLITQNNVFLLADVYFLFFFTGKRLRLSWSVQGSITGLLFEQSPYRLYILAHLVLVFITNLTYSIPMTICSQCNFVRTVCYALGHYLQIWLNVFLSQNEVSSLRVCFLIELWLRKSSWDSSAVFNEWILKCHCKGRVQENSKVNPQASFVTACLVHTRKSGDHRNYRYTNTSISFQNHYLDSGIDFVVLTCWIN